MANSWTPQQEAAMSIRDKTLLVSAAAGSGKTSVLTERIIRRLTDSQNPAKLSEMLIVTFTRASAADLKAKIAKALSEALAASPGNKHLADQLLSLGNAQISTIDSFFQKIVRSNFDVLDLPAAFRTVDTTEVLPLAMDALRSVSEASYNRSIETGFQDDDPLSRIKNNSFASAMDHLMSGRSDGKIDTILYEFHGRFASYPQGIHLLRQCAEKYRAEATAPFLCTSVGKSLKKHLLERFLSYRSFLLEITEKFKTDPDIYLRFAGFLNFDTDFCEAVLRGLSNDSYEDTQRAILSFSAFGERFPSLRGKEKPAFVFTYQAWRNKLKDRMKRLCETLRWSTKDIEHQMLQMASLCETLYVLFRDYEAKLLDEKKARGILEYNDIRAALYRLLRTENGEMTPAAKAIAAQYKEVYIDEYQDVDFLQDLIFSTIGSKHRFMVGDIKQSIYGFRGSEPSVFAGYRRAFPLNTDKDADKSDGQCVFMSNNFRCNDSVIQFTNRVCGFLFSACQESIGYTSEDDLVFSKKRGEDAPAEVPVRVACFDSVPKGSKKDTDANEEQSSSSSFSAEAAWVANEIQTLLAKETLDSGKPITPSDIAILVRSKSHGADVAHALEYIGVPVLAEAANNLLHEPLMIDTINLLRSIDNPYRDIPLSEFLLSELGGFSLEELTHLRELTGNQKSLYDAFCVASNDQEASPLFAKAARFVHWLEPLCESASALPADQFLRLLYLDPLFAQYQGQDVLLYLYEQARVYQRSAFCGLFGLLDAITKQQESNQAPTNGFKKSENAVTIMTIHHSKGLEYPVVFLCGTGKPFNRDDLNKNLLFHRNVGCASKLYNDVLGETEDTILRSVLQAEIATEQAEESIRTLYVALTRARERLYVTGTLGGNRDTAITNAELVTRADRTAILDCGSYLAWILSALYDKTSPKADPLPYVMDFYSYVPIQLSPKDATEERAEDATTEKATVAESKYTGILKRQKDFVYPLSVFGGLPTKAAASKLSPDLLDKLSAENGAEESSRALIELLSGRQPSFEELLLAEEEPSATDVGTATHAFLQYCRFDRFASTSVEEESAILQQEGFITEKTAKMLHKKQLEAFRSSRLMQEILSAKWIRREQKFHLFVPFTELTKEKQVSSALLERNLFVQGSIDLLIQTKDGRLLLVDYKTDHISNDERSNRAQLQARMKKAHQSQLFYYQRAVVDLFGCAPDETLIYSLPLGDVIEIC